MIELLFAVNTHKAIFLVTWLQIFWLLLLFCCCNAMVFGWCYFCSCYAMPLLVIFPARTIMLNFVPNCNCVEKSYQYHQE